MLAIIVLFALGFLGIAGCIVGATHHAVTAGLCIIFALRLLQERREERKRQHTLIQ